jgi:DNA mismatch endonuclease (patch repair protein)
MDRINRESRTKLMSKIRSKDTVPEVTLRKALRNSGITYRKYYGPEKIDIAIPATKIAVFVDGCFWHSCPIHGHAPKSNIGYWGKKLEKNRGRASAKDLRLKEEGWEIIHIWEHEISEDSLKCVSSINQAIGRRKSLK